MWQLGLDKEVLLVLVRIRLDSPIQDLAFPFKIPLGILQKFLQLSQFFNQKIKTIDSLATPEQTLSYKHGYFSGDFNKVERIADCTEQWIQRSSKPKG